MKTLRIFSFSLCFLFLLTSAWAQTQRGTRFVGKPVYVDNWSGLNGSYLSNQFLSASIYGGQFVMKDLAVGAGIKSTQSLVAVVKNPKTASGEFYGFARQYFKTPVAGLKVYGEAQLGFNMNYIPGLGSGNNENTNGNLQTAMQLGVSPGVSYFVGRNFSADAFVSGLKLQTSQIQNLQWQQILPKMNNVGLGIAGSVYF